MKGEETLALPTPDGKTIYVLLNSAGDTPAGQAVVIAHGLTGYPNEATYYVASRYFMARGYDVYRPFFYGVPADARKLVDCTAQIHAADLAQTCAFARGLHQRLYVVGHSYGGLALLLANPDADAFAFWDSSFDPYESFWKTDLERVPGTPFYQLNWGTSNLIGPAMIAEAKALHPGRAAAFAKKIQTPSLVALAAECIERQAPRALFEALTCEKELAEIANADHNFSRDDTIQTLCEKTESWFQRFSRKTP